MKRAMRVATTILFAGVLALSGPAMANADDGPAGPAENGGTCILCWPWE